MRARPWVLGLAAALVAAGCGGGGQKGNIDLTQPKPALSEVHPQESGAVPPVPPKAAKPKHRAAAKQESKTKAGGKLTPAKRASIAAGVAEVIVKALGFQKPAVKVDGTTATVAIPQQSACAGGPSGATLLRDRLTGGVPFTKSVVLLVQDSGAPLAPYVAVHCKPPVPPQSGGRLVLQQKGAEGVVTTKTFTVRSGTWTVSYANDGNFLQAFVLKGEKVQPMSISLTRRGTGKKTFKGPGTFALRVAGSGGWTIQVRDGE